MRAPMTPETATRRALPAVAALVALILADQGEPSGIERACGEGWQVELTKLGTMREARLSFGVEGAGNLEAPMTLDWPTARSIREFLSDAASFQGRRSIPTQYRYQTSSFYLEWEFKLPSSSDHAYRVPERVIDLRGFVPMPQFDGSGELGAGL